MYKLKLKRSGRTALFMAFIFIFASAFEMLGVTVNSYADEVVPKNDLKPFTDLKKGHWAERDIYNAYSAHAMRGYPDGTCRPDQLVRNDELIKFMIDVCYVYFPGKALIKEKGWFLPYFEKGMEKGVLPEEITKKEMWDKPATRRSMVIILGRQYGKLEMNEENKKKFDEIRSKIKDLKEGDPEEMATLRSYDIGIIKGNEKGEVNLDGNITRAEMAVVLNRIIDTGKFWRAKENW